MDPTSLDSLATRWDGWSRLSPSYAPPAGNAGAGPSHYASWRHFDSAADEPDYHLRATTLRQMNQDLHFHSSSRADRSINILPSAPARPATQPTQPVLVRAYSGNADETTNQSSSTMSPRRFFPFTASKTPASPRPSGPPLPAVQDFSIESILQAIEPDIRGTLDSIAEICGRSKLSLANEYESHIAPLGEIRAPQGGLGPVEEASSNDERRADEGVVIFDDDPNMVNVGQEIHPFSFYRYLESLRQAASARERSGGSGLDLATRTQIQYPPMQPETARATDARIPTATREFVTRPQTGRDLLATNTTAKHDGGHSNDVTTPAVVSEAHVDAQAADLETLNGPQPPSPNHLNSSYFTTSKTWYAPEAVRSVLGWLKWTARLAEPESRPALQSAESRLRAMLARSLDETTI
ncbi:unnamed protein product [Penicillium manginii]